MSVHVRRGNYYCVIYDQGKQVWEAFGKGPAGKKAAEERDLEIKLQKLRKAPRRPFSFDDLSFGDLAQQYLDKRAIDLSPKTIGEVSKTLKVYALPIIEGRPCRQITIDDWYRIQDVMTDRTNRHTKKPLSTTSLNKYFQYLHQIFSWGIANVDSLRTMPNPWDNRKPLKKRKFKLELFDIEDLRKILEHAPEHLRWAIEVEYHTGMRPGRTELFNLTWEDIDFSTGAIRIYASKTDNYHTQYVSEAFLGRLKEKRAWYREEAQRLEKRRGELLPECPYVISYQGQRITSQVARSWKAAKAAAGIDKPIRLYDLRHFYITHALKEGANVMELAPRVGHSGPEMIVRVYSHLADNLKKKEALPIPDLYETLDKIIRQDEKDD